LDDAVIADREGVGEAVMDKTYMVQLVEVQHRRGAVGGETFTRVLDLMDTHRQQPPSVPSPPPLMSNNYFEIFIFLILVHVHYEKQLQTFMDIMPRILQA
jgi:hypothetical protein